jgi:RNA polymerase sigma factor (TIGR02999 family)
MHAPSDITHLLKAWRNGEAGALDALTPLVYEELRRLARLQVRREPARPPIQPTAILHEAFLRLSGAGNIDWQDRAHFFAVASTVMRRVLVDAARARRAAKRGGDVAHVDHSRPFDFDALPDAATDPAAVLCALDDALTGLAQWDARRARVVELRFFGGLTVEETAAALDVSPQTVMRDWSLARAWLSRELGR